MVFDELHACRELQGAGAAMLTRRLKARTGNPERPELVRQDEFHPQGRPSTAFAEVDHRVTP